VPVCAVFRGSLKQSNNSSTDLQSAFSCKLDSQQFLYLSKEMSKVSSKYQITLPRELARSHRIEPGEHVYFEDAGSAIYLRRGKSEPCSGADALTENLGRFDAASERQAVRDRTWPVAAEPPSDRGWTREELYQR